LSTPDGAKTSLVLALVQRDAFGVVTMRRAKPFAVCILIIDAFDERDMYAEAFRARGHTVVTASTAIEGLRLIQQHRPDVVVQGLALPDLSGIELGKRIKQHDRSLPVIAISGFTDETTLRSARVCRFDAILLKPCLPEELLREILNAKSRTRLERAHRIPRLGKKPRSVSQ
jgi:DNA-binding NtrC family response regulator